MRDVERGFREREREGRGERRETRDKRQETRDKRQETRDKRQETREIATILVKNKLKETGTRRILDLLNVDAGVETRANQPGLWHRELLMYICLPLLCGKQTE